MKRNRTKKNIAEIIIAVIAVLLITATLLSLLQDTSVLYVQLLNFPRLQVLIALVVCGIIYVWVNKQPRRFNLLLAALIIAAVIQAYFLYPYFPLSKKSIPSAGKVVGNNAPVFSLLVANVYMKNRNASDLIKMVQEKQPTFLLAMEVNDWWVRQLNMLKKEYPHSITYPASNTYGMALYSKWPLKQPSIHFFSHDSVPSFAATVSLPNMKSIWLLTVHPVAPKPSKHPDNVHQKEVGLVKAGRMAAKQQGPALVAGDFNDVGWSYNSQMFEKISGLKDVRDGRGLFNTFSAHSLFMRWPLDYVYASHHFRVLEIERMPSFGSDHFPLYVQLALP